MPHPIPIPSLYFWPCSFFLSVVFGRVFFSNKGLLSSVRAVIAPHPAHVCLLPPYPPPRPPSLSWAILLSQLHPAKNGKIRPISAGFLKHILLMQNRRTRKGKFSDFQQFMCDTVRQCCSYQRLFGNFLNKNPVKAQLLL